jgi:hypothetical protein
MVGGASGANESPTTVMARLDQGLKVFSAIYKRIYRSSKLEFDKLYDLNRRFLRPEQYFNVLDTGNPEQIYLEDFRTDDLSIRPVADPQLSNTLMAMAKAQALMGLRGDPIVNGEAVTRMFIDAMDVPGADNLIIPPEKRQRGNPAEALAAMEAASKHAVNMANVVKTYAETLKVIAETENEEVGRQLEEYSQFLDGMIKRWISDESKQGGVLPMEAAPGDQALPGMVPGGEGQLPPGAAGPN